MKTTRSLLPLIFIFFCTRSLGQEYLFTTEELENLPVYNSIEKAKKNPEKVYKLVFYYQNLTTVPQEITLFQNLQMLDLGENKITELSPELFELKNLQILGLSHNQLKEIPPDIGKLKNLKELIIWNNQLKDLPKEIKELRKLEVLELKDNPIPIENQKKIKELLPDTKIMF